MGRLRVNRVSQPPNISALNAGNPLSKYLISAISPKDNYDLALGRPIIKGGVVNNQPTPFGIAAKSPTAASSNLLYSNIASIGAADSTMVLVVYNHALIVDANNHYAGGSYRSGSLATAIQLSNGAGTHYWQSLTGNGSTTSLSANEVLPVGLSVLVLTQRSGLISIYRNGVLKNSVSAANGNSNTTFCICDIDDVAIANSTDRAVLLGLKFSVGMTAPQVKDISNNPWQIFAPIARNSYQAAAAGGGSPYTLTADSASFSLTGQTATLAFNRTLAADSASYTLTGQATGLAFNRVLTADSASYALTGQDATLTYTPISGATYTLIADSASFALTGQPVGLAFNRVLAADTTSYALTGQDATLAQGYTLAAENGAYSLTGVDASLIATRKLVADSGAFVFTGQDATLTYTPVTLPTIGRPASDTSNAGWSASTGVDLYAMIDEVTPSASDYISASSVGAVCKVALNTTAYPGTSSQVLKFRASSSTANSLIVRLKEGATTIKTATQALTSTDTEYSMTLTAGEIAAITSGALSVELESA